MILTAFCGTAQARLEGEHTIAVFRPDSSDPMLMESFSRLCGELHMYGLRVALLDRKDRAAFSDEPPAELGGRTDVIGGVALVRTPGQASARIWIAEKATGKEALRITVSINDADAPSLLAMRAADVLRAILRDFDDPKTAEQAPQPVGDTAVAIKAEPSAPGTPRRWALQVGGAMLWETGDLGAGFAPSIDLERRVTPRLAVGLNIVAPVLGQTHSPTGATARVQEELGTLTIAGRLLSRWRAKLDLVQGFGVMHLSVEGKAQAPWVGQSASTWAAASYTGAHVGFRLSDSIELTLSVAALFLLPRPVLDVADASSTMRQPMWLMASGLRYGF